MAKNVLSIGATGFVGSAILQELVSRGHNVTALVRNPEKLQANAQDSFAWAKMI